MRVEVLFEVLATIDNPPTQADVLRAAALASPVSQGRWGNAEKYSGAGLIDDFDV
jgi:hypothetical protein